MIERVYSGSGLGTKLVRGGEQFSGSGLGTKLVRGGEQFSGSGCSTVSKGGSLNCNSDVEGGHEDENEEGSQGSGIC